MVTHQGLLSKGGWTVVYAAFEFSAVFAPLKICECSLRLQAWTKL